MKKVLFFILSFLVLSPVIQAQSVNRTDKNGLKQGPWEKKYSNGAIRYRGQFRNDTAFGEFRYFYPTGAIKSILNYQKKGTAAVVHSFYLNGKPMADGKFVHQKKDSVWNYYSEVDGKRVASETYQAGVKEGPSIIYYRESGKIFEWTTYHLGHKWGVWKKYFPDGHLSQEGFYVNDTLNGNFHVFFVGGKLQIQGAYKKGLQNGPWVFYDSTGKVINRKVFHLGIAGKK